MRMLDLRFMLRAVLPICAIILVSCHTLSNSPLKYFGCYARQPETRTADVLFTPSPESVSGHLAAVDEPPLFSLSQERTDAVAFRIMLDWGPILRITRLDDSARVRVLVYGRPFSSRSVPDSAWRTLEYCWNTDSHLWQTLNNAFDQVNNPMAPRDALLIEAVDRGRYKLLVLFAPWDTGILKCVHIMEDIAGVRLDSR
jgi:hypothetical protein